MWEAAGMSGAGGCKMRVCETVALCMAVSLSPGCGGDGGGGGKSSDVALEPGEAAADYLASVLDQYHGAVYV